MEDKYLSDELWPLGIGSNTSRLNLKSFTCCATSFGLQPVYVGLQRHRIFFCMHLRFRLKDPIATLAFGGRRPSPAGFDCVAHKWLAGAGMGWVMTCSREVFALENQLWLQGWAVRPRAALYFRFALPRVHLATSREVPASGVSEDFIRLKSNFSWGLWFIYLYFGPITLNLSKM